MVQPCRDGRSSSLGLLVAAIVAAFGTACRPGARDTGCTDCAPPDQPTLILEIRSRYGVITEASLANLVWNPLGERTPVARSATCSSDGVRALCSVPAVGPGLFVFDVVAKGYITIHVQLDMTDHLSWELLPRELDLHPEPDPACIEAFGGEDPLPRGVPGHCHTEADLPGPAAVAGACPAFASVLPPPRTVVVREQHDAFCGQPVSNFAGAFTAAQHRDAVISLIGIPPAFWTADGTSLVHNPGLEYGVAVALPTTAGFLYVDLGWDARYPYQAHVVSSSGDLIRTTRFDWRDTFGEPSAIAQEDDGSVVVVSGGSGCAAYVSGLRAIRLDPTGVQVGERWPVVSLLHAFDTARNEPVATGVPVDEAAVAGTDAAGRILVIWGGEATCGQGTLAGRWFDASGQPLSSVFVAATLDHLASPWRLQRLADGSLALMMSDGQWLRRFAEGKPAGGPPPEWLAERPHWDLRLTASGTAHIAIPGDVSCAPRIEILTGNGDLCERRDYPLPAGAPEADCEPWLMWPVGSLSVGPDGTVSRMTDIRWCEGPEYCIECVYEWWEQDLAGP